MIKDSYIGVFAKHIIDSGAFLYSDTDDFKLVSGKKSNFYINCKKALMTQEGLHLISLIMSRYIYGVYQLDSSSKDPEYCFGGMTFGADPVTIATCLKALEWGIKLKPLSVRKNKKGHGTDERIEGTYSKGNKVIVVEDVITTGGSAVEAINVFKDAGLNVVRVAVLVDRMEGGSEFIEEQTGIKPDILLTKGDLIELYS